MRFSFWTVGGGGTTATASRVRVVEQRADRLDVVDALAARVADGTNLASEVPLAQGGGADAVLMFKPLGRVMYRVKRGRHSYSFIEKYK